MDSHKKNKSSISKFNGGVADASLKNYSSYHNKRKFNEKIIKPPFKQGLFSYNQTLNVLGKNKFKKDKYNSSKEYFQIFSNSKNEAKNKYNLLNIKDIEFSRNFKLFPKTSTSINLNKYKINSNTNFNNNLVKFKINVNDNRSNIEEKKTDDIKSSNKIIYKNNIINSSNKKKKVIKDDEIEYKNNFVESQQNELESRRMIIEYIKVLNKKENNIQKIFKDYHISKKVLNQKNNDFDYYESNYKLLGEAKKQLYLKYLDYSLSYDSDNSNEEKNQKDLFNSNNLLLNDENKKINILYYLCVPKIFNLIEEDDKKQKYIFLVVPDSNTIDNGKENYFFQWRNILTNEIENEFNLKSIINCEVNTKYNNRFNIEVVNDNIIGCLNFEIETPSNEISNYYADGIEYLLNIL